MSNTSQAKTPGANDNAGVVVFFVLLGAAAVGLWLLVGVLSAARLPDFDSQRSSAMNFVVFCAAVGALTMLLVQLYRFLVPMRGQFHKDRISRWLQSIPRSPATFFAGLDFHVEPDSTAAELKALAEFESYAMDRDLTLYDLPLEQLCAQLGTVAEQTLENPRKLPFFSAYMAGMEGFPDLKILLFEPTNAEEEEKSLEDEQLELEEREAEKLAARGRLARLIQRRIDAFQISTGAAWRRHLRARVIACSTTLGALVALSGISDWRSWEVLSYLLYGLLGGALGGFLAMLFRDLVAIVELRRRA